MHTKRTMIAPGRRAWTLTGALALALALVPSSAKAAELELVYNGAFSSLDAFNPTSQGTPTFFSAPTPFTINAWFDTNSPNLAPPSPPAPPPFAGFRAYDPSLATITFGGQTYSIDTISTDPVAGMTVAIFDQNSFTPGRYAIGILQEPPLDGAGIVGDFSGATPDFTAANITPTVFTGYNGVGYGSGICLVGTGGNCSSNAITPFVLRDSNNNVFALTLGNYDENYPGAPLNTAELVAMPEPATSALAFFSLTGLLVLARRHRLQRRA